MDEKLDSEFSWPELESYSYRTLQRVAKSMSLPSNVKKVYLIQMILAKKFKTENELNNIIRKVKLERQQLSQVRKKRSYRKSYLQGSEVSSTSNSQSPPISQTPKRPSQIVVHCSPDFQRAFMKFTPKRSLLHSNATETYPQKSSNRSDRVLRSCNIKIRKPIYDLTDSSPVYSSVAVRTDTQPVFSTVQTEKNPKFSVVRAESKPIFSTARAENRPVFKVRTTEETKQSSTQTPKSRPVIRAQNISNQQVKVYKEMCSQTNGGRNLFIKTYRPAILSSNANVTVRNPVSSSQQVNNQLIRFRKSSENQSTPMPVIVNTMSGLPAKRQRVLSGIYPLLPKEPLPKRIYECVESVGFRHKDGKVSKINALIQKTTKNRICDVSQSGHNIEVTVQDIINYNIDAQTNNQTDYVITEANMINNSMNITHNTNMTHHNMNMTHHNPNMVHHNPNMTHHNMNMTHHNTYSTMPCISDVSYSQNVFDNVDQRNNDNDSQYSVYYHKKIRGEQVRSHRTYQKEDERLPKINDVFSRFNDVNSNLTQPIYVQVSEESEIQQYPAFTTKTTNTNLLENLYNFRNQFIVNQPLLQVATTTNTHCVYSTPTISTAIAQQSGSLVASDYISSSYERDDQLYNTDMSVLPRISDLLKFAEQDYRRDCQDEEMSTCSSLERSVYQNLGANVTIPEMEDALELISQDGDYMERIGMDVRMQCVLCTWAGPRIMLESHIRKDHPNDILKENKTEWTITMTLASLVQTEHWTSRILEHDSLYILSVKHDSNDYLMATLSAIETEIDLPKTGSITIYNKVTGEPYSWKGDVQCVSPNMPFDNDVDCLKLELSRLDLLPNSANLKLLNGELVMKSPTKVVIGQPELNDIHVILFVKILN